LVPENLLEVFLRERDREPRSSDSKLSPLRESLQEKTLGPEYICASSGKILAAELAEQEENRETERENEADE